ncbi:hypothetical protein CC1G_00747 [Coprinopsis cinerea okayama7|uniref:F-box domain-containing protein n=1 Tax=Coprinopsis cinerea (strain Okayama-7 / 130 / ATCC MYA-4618 / FGSC 9003) TaxID=240176 RepID=A8N9D3_COPC7|nr:hypothetical protein CC1G_00747 [Coprinopsis cinerea okayama7\|eukprot:XP_001831200.1 hypothetical protein CC1G_00747 [Coprinopsis cinerea okayama7\
MGLLGIVGRRLIKQISLQSSPVPVPDPIPTLPWELQSLILEHYSSEPETTSVKEQLLPLWVCSAWRDYLLTRSPEYWTFVHVAFHEDVVHLSKQIVDLLSHTDPSRIRLSKIVIDLAEFALHQHHRPSQHFPMARHLIPLATHSVEVLSTYTRHDHISHLCQTSEPLTVPFATFLDAMGLNSMARCFSFEKQNQGATGSWPPIFTHGNPSSQPTPFRWTNLRALSIQDDLSVTFCHAILADCGPQLEKLRLMGVKRFYDDDPYAVAEPEWCLQAANLPVIQMPKLTDLALEFHCKEGEALPFILDCPSVTNLELATTYPALMKRLAKFPFIGSNLQRLSCRSPDESTWPEAVAEILHETPNLEALEWGVDCLLGRPVRVWGAPVNPNGESLKSVNLSRLRSLKIHSSETIYPSALLYLLKGNGCPNLERLIVPVFPSKLHDNISGRRLDVTCEPPLRRNG